MNKNTQKKREAIREAILREIIKYIEQHGYPPTVREIGEMVDLKSTSVVQAHINRLFDEGKLETDAGPGSPRAIRVPAYKFRKEGRRLR